MYRFASLSGRQLFSMASLTFLLAWAPDGGLAADLHNRAEGSDPEIEAGGPENAGRSWSLILGAGASYEPVYEGSSEFEATPLPIVLFTFRDWLQIDPLGVTVTPFKYNGFSVSGTAGYELGRDQDADPRLNGLGDIDFGATVGAQVSYEWRGFKFYAAVDQTIDGSQGLTGDLGVEVLQPVTDRLFLGANAQITVADDNHMQSYFGVDAQQSVRSGLAQYDAEAGIKRADISASTMYMLTENWLVRGEAGLGILMGDAADSPIVEDSLQPKASIFIGYKF